MPYRRKTYKGLPISGGIILGNVRIILPGSVRVAEVPIPVSRISHEITALDKAIAETIVELRKLSDSAGKRIGGPVSKVFDAQLMIAGDYEFLGKVKEQIKKRRRNAGFVYNLMVQDTIKPLSKSNDPYIRQMSQDVTAVSEQVLSHLAGYGQKSTVRFQANTILVGKSFTPGEVLDYRNRKAIGFLVGEGGRSSHMALIARSLMVPVAVVEKCWHLLSDNDRIILDGTSGLVIVNPTESEWDEYQKKKKRQGPATITRIKKLPAIPPKTLDGIEVQIAANLELPGPVDEILTERKFPVGLYRTEFLYLESDSFPGEEEQFEFYSKIAATYSNSVVTLRTFDLGSDKIKADGLIPHEDNPALGWRGIRVMLDMSDIFKCQIRAIMRASVKGKFRIMLPMISDVTEFDRARKLIAQVAFDLRRSGIDFDKNIPVGIMIEVPSAALTADQFAKKVDFMSIGTNDLTQYTMSADRNNARVSGLYNSYHPSVLHLIKLTLDAGRKYNKPVSICGEIAGDLMAVPLFIGMGVSQLSMNPARIFDVCRLVSKIDSKMVQLLVGSIMSSPTTASVTKKLESYRNALENKNS